MYDSARLWSHDWFITFTSQSNLMLAAVMLWGAAAILRGWKPPPAWLRGAVVLYLMITAMVYAVIIGYPPERPATSLLGLTNTEILHGVTPLVALLLWLLFAEHQRLSWRCALLWLTYLYGYLVVMLVRAQVSPEASYPYPFINLHELGWGGLMQNIIIYTTLFFAGGVAIIMLDRRLPERTRFTDGYVRRQLAAVAS
jgi:hypothetical protein